MVSEELSEWCPNVSGFSNMTGSRGKRKASPRDNVVFEIGLFMGSLGRERTFLVTQKGIDVKLPTDLLGITMLRFSDSASQTFGRRLGYVTRAIWERIQELGAR